MPQRMVLRFWNPHHCQRQEAESVPPEVASHRDAHPNSRWDADRKGQGAGLGLLQQTGMLRLVASMVAEGSMDV